MSFNVQCFQGATIIISKIFSKIFCKYELLELVTWINDIAEFDTCALLGFDTLDNNVFERS